MLCRKVLVHKANASLLENRIELCLLGSHVLLLLQNNYCSDNKSRLVKSLQLRIFYPVGYCRERQEVEQKLMSLSGYYCISLCYIT